MRQRKDQLFIDLDMCKDDEIILDEETDNAKNSNVASGSLVSGIIDWSEEMTSILQKQYRRPAFLLKSTKTIEIHDTRIGTEISK